MTNDSGGVDWMTWERAVIDTLIVQLDITNGDAQGIVEAHPFEMAQEWAKGSSSEAAAARLINP